MKSSAHMRLCALDGVILEKICTDQPEDNGLPDSATLARPPNIYTSYIKKNGARPGPEAADAIGRLLGTRVEANDGRNYPLLSQSDKRADQRLRSTKKEYHDKAGKIASLRYAIACLETAGQPADLAVHMKNDPQIGQALDLAIEWLTRFAEEWRGREQSCYR